ncbi:SH2 domain-containing adapter protein B-like isoform X3 [Pomacea canaliculata]|uniref:SH2 domain-containing adapter protein B-like isoform X3 n=1 Tax=Pomacea canaliculata TaxID=400727 RepID=UPI000D733194|nr:SH2 domain-containing adapter protein B-like isoform X3 [Pomacea canaliculata]
MARRTKLDNPPKAKAPPSPQPRQNGVSRLTNIKDYTEPLDAKKFVWGKTESAKHVEESGEEDTFYSKPYEHDMPHQNKNPNRIPGKSLVVSDYDIPPSRDDDNHLTSGGSTSSIASLSKQGGAGRGRSGEDLDSDRYNHSSLSSLSHQTSNNSGSGSLAEGQKSTYEEPWDLKRQREVAMRNRGVRMKSDDPSGQVLYEEAWDTPQQQQRLEENLRLVRTLSVTSDKFEDALEYLPEASEPSQIRAKAGSKKTQDPVTGGTYEQAWDLNRGLEEKLRSLQLNWTDKEYVPSETDNYQEPWDTAKKQRELEEKLQRASKGSIEKLHFKDQRAGGDSQKENWPSSQAMSSSQSAETSSGSPSSRRSQATTCSIGEPINAMIPLVNQSWYHGNISRDDAERILRVCKEGSYLVRDSSDRCHYTLCIKSSRQTINIQIDQCVDAYGITVYILGKNSKAFETIPSMIDYYTHHPVPIKGAEHTTLLHPVHCQWSEADAEAWG